MTDVIVDTNVALVANRQQENVLPDCLIASIGFLREVIDRGYTLIIDDGDAIRSEYSRAIMDARPYQVGAQFLVHVLRNIGNQARVRLVPLPTDIDGEYVDFPNDLRLQEFDRSDRKFAALSRRTGAHVHNATDSDWVDFKMPLEENGIGVVFLCGCNPKRWFER